MNENEITIQDILATIFIFISKNIFNRIAFLLLCISATTGM